MSEDFHVVMDETAMVAAGTGNLVMSRVIHRAHHQEGWHLYAPVCALVEADRARPGTAEHIAILPAVVMVDLGLPAALALGGSETTWSQAHVRFAAQPTPDLPDGALIATTEPDRWKDMPVRILDLT